MNKPLIKMIFLLVEILNKFTLKNLKEILKLEELVKWEVVEVMDMDKVMDKMLIYLLIIKIIYSIHKMKN